MIKQGENSYPNPNDVKAVNATKCYEKAILVERSEGYEL